MSNQKLYNAGYCKLLCLISNFELSPSTEVQACHLKFCNLLLDPCKVLALMVETFKRSPSFRNLTSSYYTLVDTTATNNTISTKMSIFAKKVQ